MNFGDAAEEATFRAQVREFISQNRPKTLTHQAGHWGTTNVATHEMWRSAEYRAWMKALSEQGWACPSWPREYGGANLSRVEQLILLEEMAFARVPRCEPIGQIVGAVILAYGSEKQKKEHLPGIAAGEILWCQGFSEPNAGSDLASVRCRAVRDGDWYVINGQKTWTSYAHIADWMHLLVRTDWDSPKHRGLTYLVLPMDTAGITVAPIPNMRDESEFNEVFLEDVRVPTDQRIGEEGQAWKIARVALDVERANVATAIDQRNIIADLCAWSRGKRLPQELRREISARFVETEIGWLLSRRVSLTDDDSELGHAASAAKLFLTELDQRIAETMMRVFSLYGQVLDSRVPFNGRVAELYMHASSATVAGGTSEIQRNIIARRALALPRS
jgi:alkylation response protein AidB-like acyl-CoA dehydrogenase